MRGRASRGAPSPPATSSTKGPSSTILAHYLVHGVDRSDARVSPLRAENLGGLPPTLVHTAEFDPLRDEGQRYADRLAAAGTSVTYTCHAGMIHLFYGLGAVIPYARTAFDLLGAQVRAALH